MKINLLAILAINLVLSLIVSSILMLIDVYVLQSDTIVGCIGILYIMVSMFSIVICRKKLDMPWF